MLSQHGVPIASRTYYAAKTRPPAPRTLRDAQVLATIVAAHAASRGLYGYRKVYAQLAREGGVEGESVPRCQVERLMHAAGLQGVRRGRSIRTTIPDEQAERPQDLVERQFTAAAPNQLWVVDFTYVATFSGFVYVAFAIDVFSRMIVGWRAARSMRTDLPLDALDMALWHRSRAGIDLTGLIHHSDAGSQYTSIRYSERLADVGALPSIGSVGDSYDNALAESVIGLFKTELVRWEGPWKGLDDLELATLVWVDWFNNQRVHSALEYRTPREVEDEHYRQQQNCSEQPFAAEPALH